MAKPNTNGDAPSFVFTSVGAAALQNPSNDILNDGSYIFEFDSPLTEAAGGNGKGNGNGKNKSDPPDDDPPDGGSDPTPVDTYVSGQDDGADGYDMVIEFYGDGWTDDLKQTFIDSAEFLSDLITTDRPDYIAADDPNNFFDQDIDDILISATLTSIDGSGGVLGQAGPTHIIIDDGETATDALPFAGIMEFDTADAQDFYDLGLWDDIVLHEMLHVVGLGSMWEYKELVELLIDDNGTRKPVDDTITYQYLGTNALDPSGQTPLIEADGGSGTAGAHWDEVAYDNELMTGYIDLFNIIEDMTYYGLVDLGYDIDTGLI